MACCADRRYDSVHWTQPTTLNEDDLTTDDGDAKYPAFNTEEFTEVPAHGPPAARPPAACVAARTVTCVQARRLPPQQVTMEGGGGGRG